METSKKRSLVRKLMYFFSSSEWCYQCAPAPCSSVHSPHGQRIIPANQTNGVCCDTCKPSSEPHQPPSHAITTSKRKKTVCLLHSVGYFITTLVTNAPAYSLRVRSNGQEGCTEKAVDFIRQMVNQIIR